MSPAPEDEQDDNCIRIPVRGANQTVEVYTDELPGDYNDVVDVLKAEIAPLDIWLRFAVRETFFCFSCLYNVLWCIHFRLCSLVENSTVFRHIAFYVVISLPLVYASAWQHGTCNFRSSPSYVW